jgi:hypothetical protein
MTRGMIFIQAIAGEPHPSFVCDSRTTSRAETSVDQNVAAGLRPAATTSHVEISVDQNVTAGLRPAVTWS